MTDLVIYEPDEVIEEEVSTGALIFAVLIYAWANIATGYLSYKHTKNQHKLMKHKEYRVRDGAFASLVAHLFGSSAFATLKLFGPLMGILSYMAVSSLKGLLSKYRNKRVWNTHEMAADLSRATGKQIDSETVRQRLYKAIVRFMPFSRFPIKITSKKPDYTVKEDTMSYYDDFYEELLEELLIEKILTKNNARMKKNTLAHLSAMARKQQKDSEHLAREAERKLREISYFDRKRRDRSVENPPELMQMLKNKRIASLFKRARQKLIDQRRRNHTNRLRDVRETLRRSVA